jgi:hypothetical protein
MEITLDPTVVALVGGALVPILTGLVTKYDSATGWKAGAALVLSVLVGCLTAATQDGSFTGQEILEAASVAFGANTATYLGAWKPLGSTDAVPLQMATANFGLGKPSEDGGL